MTEDTSKIQLTEEIKAKAKKLYQEYKESSGLLLYSSKQKAGFVRRIKNLAGYISPASNDNDEIGALMYLDTLATRMDFDLTPSLKGS